MSVNDSDPTAGPRRWTALPFAAATLLGAFLLFQVQPLIGKFILPWFGGAPAVWTTCMLFFQIALFSGYAYSHLLVERLSLRGQAVAQCGLLLIALFMLPIVPTDLWKPKGDETPTTRILLLLSATVGLPYFVLATTSPLIQSWFSRVHPGRAPYRLYALSNVGSLAALLSYPFVFEPAFSLGMQARIWSWSFRPMFSDGHLRGDCGTESPQTRNLALRKPRHVPPVRTERRHSPRPLGSFAPWWLLLPACASVILLATTNHVCQDVAPRPFLWVMPLALYLFSFVSASIIRDGTSGRVWAMPAVIGIAVVLGSDASLASIREPYQHAGITLAFPYILLLHFGTMFCICMVCHGEACAAQARAAALDRVLSLAGRRRGARRSARGHRSAASSSTRSANGISA